MSVTRYTYQHAMEVESGVVHYVHMHAINVFCGAYFSGIATIVSPDNVVTCLFCLGFK